MCFVIPQLTIIQNNPIGSNILFFQEEHYYISTDEVVERYCYCSRNQYFMVTKLRNYSTTAEATMTKFELSSKAIYLGGNPTKMNFLAIQVTEIFDLNGKPQKG